MQNLRDANALQFIVLNSLEQLIQRLVMQCWEKCFPTGEFDMHLPTEVMDQIAHIYIQLWTVLIFHYSFVSFQISCYHTSQIYAIFVSNMMICRKSSSHTQFAFAIEPWNCTRIKHFKAHSHDVEPHTIHSFIFFCLLCKTRKISKSEVILNIFFSNLVYSLVAWYIKVLWIW